MSDVKVHKSGAIGLPGALFLVFVVLRLTDHIDWAWYWVAAPLWAPLTALLAGLLAAAVAFVVIGYPLAKILNWRDRRRARARKAKRDTVTPTERTKAR